MKVNPQCSCSPAPQDRKKRINLLFTPTSKSSELCLSGSQTYQRIFKHQIEFSCSKILQKCWSRSQRAPYCSAQLPSACYHLQGQGFSFSQDKFCLLSTKGLQLWINNNPPAPPGCLAGTQLGSRCKTNSLGEWGKREERRGSTGDRH